MLEGFVAIGKAQHQLLEIFLVFIYFTKVLNGQCNICTEFNQNECCSGFTRCCNLETRNDGNCSNSTTDMIEDCQFRCIADGQCPPGQKCCPPNRKVCILNSLLKQPRGSTQTATQGTTVVTQPTSSPTTQSTSTSPTVTQSTSSSPTVRGRRQIQSNQTACPLSIPLSSLPSIRQCGPEGTCPNGSTCCPAPLQLGCCVTSV